MSVSPNPGDRVKITYEATVRQVDAETGRPVWVQQVKLGTDYGVPGDATVEVLEPADDPGAELNGAVRKSPEDGRVVVCARHVDPVGTERRCWIDLLPVPHRNWLLVDKDVIGWERMGAVPGTPAAEANPVPPAVLERAREMLANGQRTRAVTAVREACFGMGLFVDSLQRRQPRVFQSDGPEPPEDVTVVHDADGGTFMPYLHKVPGGWRWGGKPDALPPDHDLTSKCWHVAARGARGDRLVEVLDV